MSRRTAWKERCPDCGWDGNRIEVDGQGVCGKCRRVLENRSGVSKGFQDFIPGNEGMGDDFFDQSGSPDIRE